MSSEPSTARPLAVWVRIQDQTYLWTPGEGLEPSAVATVDNWIWRRARALSRLAAVAGLAVDDLVQEGRIGALKAARTYEPGHAANFLTWAVYWIRNAMADALDGAGDIHVPRDLRRTLRQKGQQPTVFSLDAAIHGAPEVESPTTWATLLASDPEPTDEVGQRARMALRAALESLRPQDREVLWRRFGFQGDPETLESIGQAWGLSRQRISQIELRARLRLRAALSPKSPARAPKAQKGPAMPTYARQLTITDAIRERDRKANAQTKAEATARKNRKRAAAGTPLFHLEPNGRMDLRASCPDCEPAGSGLYQGRVCEGCGGSGVAEPES